LDSLLGEALELARGIEDDGARARVLVELAPRLAEPAQVETVLELVRGIGDERARNRALAELVQVETALELVGGIGDEWARAQALVELAPRLAEPAQVESALELARGIEDEGVRAWALAVLAPCLAALPRSQVLPLWEETLCLSTTRSRRDVLADLGALAPVIASLGGSEAIEAACRAIEDVGRWWP
jgi:hypothetical protein